MYYNCIEFIILLYTFLVLLYTFLSRAGWVNEYSMDELRDAAVRREIP